MEGVNPAKIYFKHICKYHSISPCTTIMSDTIINKIKLSFYKFKKIKKVCLRVLEINMHAYKSYCCKCAKAVLKKMD
jgi:hypothetical protein